MAHGTKGVWHKSTNQQINNKPKRAPCSGALTFYLGTFAVWLALAAVSAAAVSITAASETTSVTTGSLFAFFRLVHYNTTATYFSFM